MLFTVANGTLNGLNANVVLCVVFFMSFILLIGALSYIFTFFVVVVVIVRSSHDMESATPLTRARTGGLCC